MSISRLGSGALEVRGEVATLVPLSGVLTNGHTLRTHYPTGAAAPSAVCCAADAAA